MKKAFLAATLAVACLGASVQMALACPAGYSSGSVCVASISIDGASVCIKSIKACVRIPN